MSKRILYVEAVQQNRLLMRRIVEAEGNTMLEAVDGDSGWETAVSQQPDLILMDLHLDGTTDMSQRIKNDETLCNVPLIAVTNLNGSGSGKETAVAAGCDDLLQKPADIGQIRTVLHAHLNGSQKQPSETFTFI